MNNICQEPNCTESGIECYFPDNETDEPDRYYCATHIFNHGFCWGCGYFWSGVESFDFSETLTGIGGLCPNCRYDYKDDLDEEDELEFSPEDYYWEVG